MGLFRKKTLHETGLLKDATEWHCHLLPGVDDGVQTLEESLQILDIYEQEGVKEIWLTPHIMEDYPNTPKELQEKFRILKQSYTGNISLHLSAENMLDGVFEQRLASKDLLPIGLGGNHLLVETSYFSPPSNFWELLSAIKSAGYYPVLAHPERYVYMDMGWYKRLIEENVKLQMNIYSLQGAYGEESKQKALHLLKKGFYALAGTDTHRIGQIRHFLDMAYPVKRADLIPTEL